MDLNGLVHFQQPSKRVMNIFVSTIAIEKKLGSLYELEHFDDELHTSHEDDQVMKLWNQRGKVTDGHIELPIPWKNDARTRPDNKYIAEFRHRWQRQWTTRDLSKWFSRGPPLAATLELS